MLHRNRQRMPQSLKKDFVTVKEYAPSHGHPESSLESENTEYNNRNA